MLCHMGGSRWDKLHSGHLPIGLVSLSRILPCGFVSCELQVGQPLACDNIKGTSTHTLGHLQGMAMMADPCSECGSVFPTSESLWWV